MTQTKDRVVVPTVDELNGYVTVQKAAEIMGVAHNSVGGIVHKGLVKACRISGVFLVERASAEVYRKTRDERVIAHVDDKLRQAKLRKLSGLTDEQLDALLDQIENGNR